MQSAKMSGKEAWIQYIMKAYFVVYEQFVLNDLLRWIIKIRVLRCGDTS